MTARWTGDDRAAGRPARQALVAVRTRLAGPAPAHLGPRGAPDVALADRAPQDPSVLARLRIQAAPDGAPSAVPAATSSRSHRSHAPSRK